MGSGWLVFRNFFDIGNSWCPWRPSFLCSFISHVVTIPGVRTPRRGWSMWHWFMNSVFVRATEKWRHSFQKRKTIRGNSLFIMQLTLKLNLLFLIVMNFSYLISCTRRTKKSFLSMFRCWWISWGMSTFWSTFRCLRREIFFWFWTSDRDMWSVCTFVANVCHFDNLVFKKWTRVWEIRKG